MVRDNKSRWTMSANPKMTIGEIRRTEIVSKHFLTPRTGKEIERNWKNNLSVGVTSYITLSGVLFCMRLQGQPINQVVHFLQISVNSMQIFADEPSSERGRAGYYSTGESCWEKENVSERRTTFIAPPIKSKTKGSGGSKTKWENVLYWQFIWGRTFLQQWILWDKEEERERE